VLLFQAVNLDFDEDKIKPNILILIQWQIQDFTMGRAYFSNPPLPLTSPFSFHSPPLFYSSSIPNLSLPLPSPVRRGPGYKTQKNLIFTLS
jgi:hypothetical protein